MFTLSDVLVFIQPMPVARTAVRCICTKPYILSVHLIMAKSRNETLLTIGIINNWQR